MRPGGRGPALSRQRRRAAPPETRATSAATAEHVGTGRYPMSRILNTEPRTMDQGPEASSSEGSSEHLRSSKRFKLQAASLKPQAASLKLQAPSDKILDPRSFIKYHGTRTKVLDHNKTILWVKCMKGNLVWTQMNRINFGYL